MKEGKDVQLERNAWVVVDRGGMLCEETRGQGRRPLCRTGECLGRLELGDEEKGLFLSNLYLRIWKFGPS